MTEKDPNNLFENFFQNKAKDYDIPFNEGDWLNLEKKLDLRDAQIAFKNKVKWILAAAILILSFLGYFTYENHNRLNQISQQLGSDTSQPTVQPPVIAPFPEAENPENESDADQNGQFTEEHADDDEEINENALTQHSNQGDEISTHQEKDEADEARETYFGAGEISLPQPDQITFATLSPVLLTDHESYNPQIIVSASEVSKNDQKPGSFPQLALAEPEHDIQNQFAMGFVAGPDVSSVGAFDRFQDPGYKIGLILEYRISSNLSVSTGAVQSMVRYSTEGQRYNPPIYWTSGISPDEMIGECLLIDIPINLKYNFLNFNNSRFYASAGISSYIMLNEEYRFKYEEDNYGLIQNWSGRTGTRHWMSHAGFSLGYELDLHPNWSLRAEPFIKTPIREVGWSNVRLFSAGSFFSLTYHL